MKLYTRAKAKKFKHPKLDKPVVKKTKVFRVNLYKKEKQIFVSKKQYELKDIRYYCQQMVWYAKNYPHIIVKIYIRNKDLGELKFKDFADCWQGAPSNIRVKLQP